MAGKAPNKKRKAIIEVEVAAVHELESDSDGKDGTEDGGTCGTGTTRSISSVSGGTASM